MTDVIYKEKYVDDELLGRIKTYFNDLNDEFSGRARVEINPICTNFKGETGLPMEGSADRPLRLENADNPTHELVQKLKEDWGDFHIHTCSVRYLYFPYGPHSDVQSSERLIESREKYKYGYTFLIPLSWKSGYTPGTAFFDSPPKQDQVLHAERPDVLPRLQKESASKNYGINRLVTWKNPGDLVGWMNYRYHSSMIGGERPHNEKEWCKEFISIETYRFRDN